MEPILKRTHEGFPVVLDHEGLISEVFAHNAELPCVKLLNQRKIVFESSGSHWFEGVEIKLQRFLRLIDPGLPLAPPLEPLAENLDDIASAEFGGVSKSTIFKISGPVSQETQRVVIQSPASSIQFVSPSPRVSIIAQSAVPSRQISRMRIELNGDTVFELAAAEDLTFGDDGSSEIKVGEARLYHVLRELPDKARQITLRFPDSDKLPVALYGVRF